MSSEPVCVRFLRNCSIWSKDQL